MGSLVPGGLMVEKVLGTPIQIPNLLQCHVCLEQICKVIADHSILSCSPQNLFPGSTLANFSFKKMSIFILIIFYAIYIFKHLFFSDCHYFNNCYMSFPVVASFCMS